MKLVEKHLEILTEGAHAVDYSETTCADFAQYSVLAYSISVIASHAM